ncbi:MAG TPA: hypothetical protein VHA55_15100 [Pseudorhodoplanes sp.]|nr:hypothetical protein [Pseudorhodoplanes sp.]
MADDGPQWPNVPLPAPQEDASPLSREAFEARWPSVPDDITNSVPARRERRAVWLGEERASSTPFAAQVPPAFDGELGVRYWFSWAKTGKDLYDMSGTGMVSRLTYDGMHGHAGEAFGRFDHTSGFYAKGYAGGGLFFNGQLNDEDFPPAISPYSSTLSDLKGSSLAYANADLGFNLWRDPRFRLGAFAGYHYFNERVNAYGCTQIATNSGICGVSPVPPSVEVITQDNSWHSLRVGVDFDLLLAERLKLRADAAYLPYVKLFGTDWHRLRIGTLPGDFVDGIPEDGVGRGYQLEAALSYAVNENVDIAVGARYWHMQSSGNTHFEGNIVGGGGSPQPVDWKTDIFGVFVQGSFKFGPYATGSL